jgi:excisionase family DNA binding protein
MPEASDAPLQDWITTGEAAELTGYTQAYVRQLILKGRLKAHKLGRDWFLKRSDVEEYAEQMETLGDAKYDPWRTGARKRKDEEANE